MIVYGNIATPLEARKAKESGKEYFTFRLAENQGKDEHRKTTWYDTVAFIPEMDADMLSKGMLVKVMGEVTAESFTKRDGTPGASLKLKAFKVEPYEPKRRDAPADEA